MSEKHPEGYTKTANYTSLKESQERWIVVSMGDNVQWDG